MALPDAVVCPELAKHLSIDTETSVEEAAAILAKEAPAHRITTQYERRKGLAH
jgi:hypothetical protein